MKKDRRRVIAGLAAMPLACGAILAAGAASASAAPSQNASCVAQFTSAFGPNQGAGGPIVSFVAHLPKGSCFIP